MIPNFVKINIWWLWIIPFMSVVLFVVVSIGIDSGNVVGTYKAEVVKNIVSEGYTKCVVHYNFKEVIYPRYGACTYDVGYIFKISEHKSGIVDVVEDKSGSVE